MSSRRSCSKCLCPRRLSRRKECIIIIVYISLEEHHAVGFQVCTAFSLVVLYEYNKFERDMCLNLFDSACLICVSAVHVVLYSISTWLSLFRFVLIEIELSINMRCGYELMMGEEEYCSQFNSYLLLRREQEEGILCAPVGVVSLRRCCRLMGANGDKRTKPDAAAGAYVCVVRQAR